MYILVIFNLTILGNIYLDVICIIINNAKSKLYRPIMFILRLLDVWLAFLLFRWGLFAFFVVVLYYLGAINKNNDRNNSIAPNLQLVP